MKNFIPVLFIFMLLFNGCYNMEDDLINSNNCKDCTRLLGRITTTNGTIPMSNMDMELYWIDGKGELGGTIRKKAVARTDKNGYYDLVFQMRDEELARGYFNLTANVGRETYFNSLRSVNQDWKSLNLIEFKKDTLINLNYNVPKRAFIEMQATNPREIKPQDYFACTYTFLEGIDGKQETNIVGSLNYPNTMEVAAEQPVILTFDRIKNGILSQETDTLILKPLQTYKYSITF